METIVLTDGMVIASELDNVSLRPNPLPDKPHWLRAATQGAVGVDRVNKAILGYVVAQEGPFREQEPRGEFDDKALKQIVKLMKANAGGTKSRMGHPTASDDGLGKFLGRAHNPRMDAVQVMRDGKPVELLAVRADLHLSATAFEGNPNGNIGEYVLSLAEKDPAAFGSSLVLRVEEEVRLEKNGTRKLDEAGNPMPPLWRPLEIHASDVVDEGAAVDSMLGTAGMPDSLLRQGVQLLDAQFAGQSREAVKTRLVAFLERYLTMRFDDEPEVTATEPPAEVTVTADEDLLLDIDLREREAD